MPFSLAIFSALSPMVRPVVGSLSAGRNRGDVRERRPAKARTLSGTLRAREAFTSAWASLWEAKMGASESDSAPPAMTRVGVAEQDLVGRVGGGLEGGGAGAGRGVGRERPGQLGAQHHLATDERGELGRDHLAEDERVELGEGEAAPGDELVHQDRAQVDGREVPEVAARPHEGGAKSGDHRDPWRGRAVRAAARVVVLVLPVVGHDDPRIDS